MTAQTWVSIGLAAIALVALYFTALSAMNARAQTAVQKRVREDAAQPYLWADIRPDEQQGGLLLLLIGNSGSTVATDVRVTFDPPPERQVHPGDNEESTFIERISDRGVASVPPGRTLVWSLGAAHQLIREAAENGVIYTVTLDGTGPFGPVAQLSYQIDLADILENLAVGFGSPRLVAKSIDQIGKLLEAKF